MVVRFLILLTLSAASWGDEGSIADCLDVAGKMERLVCYDERAREYRLEFGGGVAAPLQAPRAVVIRGQTQTQTQTQGSVDATEKRSPIRNESNEDNFGRLELVAAPTEISSHIESIRKTPLGNYIMTLSNGQIWSENEPNRRAIEAEQDVTIKKKRLHYEMRLESGRRVPVRRIDTG